MTKRMLIDDTQPEETRVVIVDGNKVEDVEFESSSRKQIKGNIYTAKVIRVEPSLQAAFIDYGGNKHGFLAFGEIHPDYYNASPELLEAVDREVDEIIERKKQYLKEREEQRARIRAEKQALYEARKREEEARLAQAAAENEQEQEQVQEAQTQAPEETPANTQADNQSQNISVADETSQATEAVAEVEATEVKKPKRKYTRRKKVVKNEEETVNQVQEENTSEQTVKEETSNEEFKVLSAANEETAPIVREDENVDDYEDDSDDDDEDDNASENENDDNDDEDEDFGSDEDFEMQRKLLRARKLYHYSTIQDVIKEGQTLLIQVVKEERGNKGAACTTYLSLAGRYCVLMPNRIKSGGVSRKITNGADRKRLKEIMKELPLTSDMSMIIRTAGEDKTKADIVRDYNYLIRTWNHIRLNALKNKVPSLIYEEGDLIKRALRDMYTKDISEVIVDGNEAYKAARDFVKILSPSNLKKIKCRKPNELPVFQRFQIEAQLDKLHNPVVQLESGGYLVINPTEALVSIDVNSGRATKEKDIEETALKTNLEAADEIAKQLRMRNLAGLVVVDFIDMDEPQNNTAVEKRMKEALKNDRARIQVAKMSCFGLLEISRQRMHSSFIESNYQPCPFCHGQGVVRTTESGAMLILRAIEEEGTKNRSSKVTVFVPTDTAIYLLNQKRQNLCDLESRYKMSVVISADGEIKNVSDYRIERTKLVKTDDDEEENQNTPATTYSEVDEQELADADDDDDNDEVEEENDNERGGNRFNRRFRGRRSRYDRRRGRNNRRDFDNNGENQTKEYNQAEPQAPALEEKKEGKLAWWRKLIG